MLGQLEQGSVDCIFPLKSLLYIVTSSGCINACPSSVVALNILIPDEPAGLVAAYLSEFLSHQSSGTCLVGTTLTPCIYQ